MTTTGRLAHLPGPFLVEVSEGIASQRTGLWHDSFQFLGLEDSVVFVAICLIPNRH